MTAFADTMIFMTVMMMAVSVTVMASVPDDDDCMSPDEFLDMLPEIHVRLSDMTDMEDGTLISLTDAMAYSADHDSSVPGYLESLLDSVYGHGRYCLLYTYGEHDVTIGDTDGPVQSSASSDAAVSVGGHLTVRLSLHA